MDSHPELPPSFSGDPVDFPRELLELYHESQLNYDLREGVIYNRASTRLCLFTTDLLKGVYQAVRHESGDAWSTIFKNCGRVWGRRVIHRLRKELDKNELPSIDDLSTEHVMLLMENNFRFHGWGDLELDASLMDTRGFITAVMAESLFAEVIEEGEKQADAMITGMLASIFSEISAADLDCAQTDSARLSPRNVSRFIISGRKRIEKVQSLVDDGVGHDEIVKQL